ncbi:unnamed protein product [Triticum turgidum subsp. durum]|uniref:Uncharacterized protein n=1 Tax=Triticum turgidum subsp. durum TaxID=4567 RepID=A0A9R0QNM2_TRITD|nr:unnamed protein product [Triticum turgidum subsp. durum]
MDCCDASILVTVSSKLQHCSLRQCSPSVKTLFTCSRTGRRVGQRRNYLFARQMSTEQGMHGVCARCRATGARRCHVRRRPILLGYRSSRSALAPHFSSPTLLAHSPTTS